MRARVRYTKTGKIRFVSAIDLGRLWERALRRAELPIAYSEGFSPHPKISFPDALPLGYASVGEYAELTFAAQVDLERGVAAVNAAFPAGLEILDARVVQEGEPKLSRWLAASCWDLRYPADAWLADAVADIDRAEHIPIERERKQEITVVDLRPTLHQISHVISEEGQCVRAVLHHHEVAMRASEVHAALTARVPDLCEPDLVTRIAQGKPVTEGLLEALSGEIVAMRLVPPAHELRESDNRDRRQHRLPGARRDQDESAHARPHPNGERADA